jgi:asparagine synthase (glutamine-hydrolysing)
VNGSLRKCKAFMGDPLFSSGMLGVFGVIDLTGHDRGDQVHALAGDMARRLTSRQDEQLLRRGERIAFGRAGASYHHNVPWPDRADAPAFAGIVHSIVGDARYLSDKDAAGLRGFFAAIVPRRDGGSAIMADRRASVPVFYAESDGFLLFAPKVSALLIARNLPRDVNLAAIASFLASGHLAGAHTLFRAVRHLRGGEALQVAPDGTIQIERYWQFKPGSRPEKAAEPELAEALLDRMEAAANRNLQQPDRSFIFFSGGADSRGLLGAALRSTPADRITTVTWTRDEGGERSDLDVASHVASVTGVRHIVLRMRPGGFREHLERSNAMLDALTDSAPLNYYLLLVGEELADRGLLTGLRGDEVFGWWYPVASFEEALVAVGLRTVDEAAAVTALQPELRDKVRDAQLDAHRALGRELEGLRPDQMKDRLYFENRLQNFLSVQERLLQGSLDHRNPFLDEEILEFMEVVPDCLRAQKLLYQRALVRRHADLWQLGIAGRAARPEYETLVARDPGILPYLQAELEDVGSGVWDLLDREHYLRCLARLVHPQTASSPGWKPFVMSTVRQIRPMLPRALALRLKNRQPALKPVGLARHLLRMVALKHWHDHLRVA